MESKARGIDCQKKLLLMNRLSRITIIDTYKSSLGLYNSTKLCNVDAMDPFVPDISTLKQLLLQPLDLKTTDFGHTKEIHFSPIQYQDPWTFYLCSRHDDRQLLMMPRNVFTMVFHYISNAIVTPATCQDHIVSVLKDMRQLKYQLSLVDMRLIIVSFYKCSVLLKPLEMIDYVSKWPLEERQRYDFLFLLCERYLELQFSHGYSSVIMSMLQQYQSQMNGIVHQSKSQMDVQQIKRQMDGQTGVQQKKPTDSIVRFCLKLDFDKDGLVYKVLEVFDTLSIEIDPFLYSKLLAKTIDTFDNLKLVQYLYRMYIKQGMVDPIHFQSLLRQCKLHKMYKEAHMLWCYASALKCRKRMLNRVFLPIETSLLYCEILLEQKRSEEAGQVFRNALAALPFPNRRGRALRHCQAMDLHGSFLLLCLRYCCYDLFQEYLECIRDNNIPLSREMKSEITEQMQNLTIQ